MPCLYRKNGNAIVAVVLRDEKSMIPYDIANTVRSIIVYKCSCGVREYMRQCTVPVQYGD